ncbi:MAG TPA: hypothetical protein VNC40_04340 [Gaiellaceae bacterium]|nr:hypothetical protein [Gaiellaceae bacterium]
MSRSHIALISGLLALAAVVGTVAATRTVSLSSTSRQSVDAIVAARTKQLDRLQAALQRALAKRPPARVAAAAAPTPRVVYRRPPSILVVKHVHHGDDGAFENADGGGGGDG